MKLKRAWLIIPLLLLVKLATAGVFTWAVILNVIVVENNKQVKDKTFPGNIAATSDRSLRKKYGLIALTTRKLIGKKAFQSAVLHQVEDDRKHLAELQQKWQVVDVVSPCHLIVQRQEKTKIVIQGTAVRQFTGWTVIEPHNVEELQPSKSVDLF